MQEGTRRVTRLFLALELLQALPGFARTSSCGGNHPTSLGCYLTGTSTPLLPLSAVLSHCQVWRIPAVLYLCYTDVMRLDPVTVGAFQPLLRSSSLWALVKVREAGEQAGEWDPTEKVLFLYPVGVRTLLKTKLWDQHCLSSPRTWAHAHTTRTQTTCSTHAHVHHTQPFHEHSRFMFILHERSTRSLHTCDTPCILAHPTRTLSPSSFFTLFSLSPSLCLCLLPLPSSCFYC